MAATSQSSFGTAENVHLLRVLMMLQGGVNGVIMAMWVAIGILFPIFNGAQGGAALTLLVFTGIFWLGVFVVGYKIDGKQASWIWASLCLQAISVILWLVSLTGNLSPVSFINLAISLLALGFAGNYLHDIKKQGKSKASLQS